MPRSSAGQCAFFDGEVGVQVRSLDCSDCLVAQPECDNARLDPGLVQLDRASMAKGVGPEFLAVQGGTSFGSVGDVFGEATFDGVGAELAAADAGEQRIGGPALPFA